MPDDVDGKADHGKRAGSGGVADHELLSSCWRAAVAEVGDTGNPASGGRIQTMVTALGPWPGNGIPGAGKGARKRSGAMRCVAGPWPGINRR